MSPNPLPRWHAGEAPTAPAPRMRTGGPFQNGPPGQYGVQSDDCGSGSVMALAFLRGRCRPAQPLVRRRATTPRARRPAPMSAQVDGSGTVVPGTKSKFTSTACRY